MFSKLTFFSFVDLDDPTQRGEYDRWHQLDHRPENLALPGVAFGDRWAVRDEYVEHGMVTGSEEYRGIDYVAMYWFRDPIDAAIREWDALGEASFQWGRGPLIPGIRRPMLAFFRPVKGYAAPRALVSPEVLPFRPNRGIHVTVTRYAEAHSGAVHDAHRREDRDLIPAVLDVPGVAGAWTFSFSHAQRHSSLPFTASTEEAPGSMRIRLVYLEDDPATVATALSAATSGFDSAGETALSAPLSTIIPWQDW